VVLVKTELGLNRRRVDPIFVKASTDFPSKLHVACRAVPFEVERDLNMKRCDQFGIRKLPDVNVVARDDAIQLRDIVADVVNRQSGRHSLKENSRGRLAQGNRRAKNDDGNDQRNERV